MWVKADKEPDEKGYYAVVYYDGRKIFPTAIKYNGYWDNDTNFDLLYYHGPFSKGVTAFDWAHENIDKAPMSKLLDVYIKGR